MNEPGKDNGEPGGSPKYGRLIGLALAVQLIVAMLFWTYWW